MRSILDFINVKKNIDSLIAAIAGFILVYLFTAHSGVGVSPDSAVYLSAARNLDAHGTLWVFNGGPLVDFPVFYPFFLGAVMFITRQDALTIGTFINGGLFAMIVYLCGCLMQKEQKYTLWYKWFILLCVIFSPSLMEIYSMLWSETLFIFFVVLFIVFFKNYFRDHRPLSALLLVGVITGLACITRYAGVVLIGTGGLLILCHHGIKWKQKIIQCFVFGVPAVAILLYNLVRNARITGTFTGEREKGVTAFTENMRYMGDVFCDWLPFASSLHKYAAVITGVLLVFAIIYFIKRIIARKQYTSFTTIAIAFFIVYVLFILVSATISRYETLNNRLLSPLYIVMLWTLTCWIPVILKQFHNTGKKIALLVTFVVAGVVAWNQYIVTRSAYNDVKDSGIPGYTDDSWQKSSFTRYLLNNKSVFNPGYTIYCNAYDGLYFLTGMPSASLPHYYIKDDMENFMQDKKHYIVWFNQVEDEDLVTKKFIEENQRYTILYQDKDGVVYWCKE